MKIGIIQLGRHGDCVMALPIAYALAYDGHDVHWYVSKAFAAILEPVSYVTIHALDLMETAVARAQQIAERDGCERVITPQVDGNPAPTTIETENFSLRQFANAGPEWLARFHDFKPAFDKRDRAGEAEAMTLLGPADPNDTRPWLMYCLKSHSSPYTSYADDTQRWIERTFGEQYQTFDLSPLKLPKPHHLLGLLGCAACLITVDTLTLHLATATNTPTIQLSAGTAPNGRPSFFYDSEPRAHVIFKTSYKDSVTPLARGKMEKIIKTQDFAPGRLVRAIDPLAVAHPPITKERIWHVADWYVGNAADNPRIFRARATWEDLRKDPYYEICLHKLKAEQRNSTQIGDKRALPYIADIIDHGDLLAQAGDILVWTNSDVSFVPEALNEIRKKLASMPCCFSRRIDVRDNAPRRTLRDLASQPAHVGADLFAMRASFWREHGAELPFLFLGAEGWDWVMRHWMWKYAPQAEMRPPVIYHQAHQSEWAKRENIKSAPSQLHNRDECQKWAYAHGLDAALYGDKSPFLFRDDAAWLKGRMVRP